MSRTVRFSCSYWCSATNALRKFKVVLVSFCSNVFPSILLLPATCLVSEWTLWSQCSCVSGAGSRFRTRSVVPSGGGIANCGGPSFTCRTVGFSCTNGAVSCSDGSQPLQIDQNSWGSCDNHRETQPCFLSQCSHGKQFILCFLLQMNRDPVGSKNCF